jgi:DNA-binding beta-propeller fold protein YncE
VIDGVSNTVRSSTTSTVSPTNVPQGGKVAVNPDTSKVYVTYCDNIVITNPDSSVDGTFYLNVYSEQ